jgi:hypothetical protein
MLTAERLRELLDYDPETGVFRWRETRGRARNGERAGSDNGAGYLVVEIGGRGYRAHRLAWLYVHGAWPPGKLDHDSNVRSDNRIANLRLATHAQNARNRKRRRDNETGFKGVHLRKDTGRYRATITLSGCDIALGNFDSADEAASAYASAASRLFGEFARTE